ncbi:MAG TPA: DUF6338 family protein [Acetobacteraceae bacterium]
MKLEDFSNLFFVVSVLVPGFIYSGVMSVFVPVRAHREREVILLRYLTATAFNYAICSPLIYLLIFGVVFRDRPVGQALCWFFIVFTAPIVLALVRAWTIQQDRLAGIFRSLGLRAISPIPTGWDWIFGTTEPCYVLITLTDGTEIAGYFGRRSMASSDPDRKDIYIEKVYAVPEEGGPWIEVQRSLGMHVDGSQIAYIEFRR